MNYQFKGFQFSFIIHAVIFLSIIGISSSIVSVSKAIVIDFNIENPMYSSRESPSAPSTKTGVKPHKPEVREQKTEQKIETQVAVTTPSPISETQVEVPAPAPPTTEIVSPHYPLLSNPPIPPLLKGGEGGLSGGSGDSYEKAKMRYLKEHFAYIRDMIMKNISYPHMARQMGWEGRVVISFVVEESGRVEDIRVIESSGIGLLDKNAVQTIIKASPFPKPPIKAALIIPVVYKLN